MEGTMRICCISYKFAPLIGGAEGRAEKQARQLQAFGHDVTVLTLRLNRKWKRVELLDGLPVVRIGGVYRRGGELRLGKFGHSLIEIGILLTIWRWRHRYDIIHAFQLTPPSVVAALLAHLIQKPMVISIQNAGPDEKQLAQLKSAREGSRESISRLQIDMKEDWAIRGSDVTGLPHVMLGGHAALGLLRRSRAFYQVLSTRCHAYLIASGFSAERIITIAGSADTEKFRPLQEGPNFLARSERSIICIARLEYAKGIDVLLHAWARLLRTSSGRASNLQPKLLLVGEGRYRVLLERMATELGIQNSVAFLGQRRDIVALLQGAWGFALPSRWEGMPNALLEAMACGLPCVATQVSGSEDVITDGVNGFLVAPGDHAALAQALQSIIENTRLARALGNAARATVVRDYRLSSVVERCVELYQRLVREQQW